MVSVRRASGRNDPVEGTRTQALFREINDRIETFVNETRAEEPELDFLCECADKECVEVVALAEGEYESVRRFPARFFVLPGHQVPDAERVVAGTDRYVVVEKFGEGGRFAVRSDPRRRTAESPGWGVVDSFA